MNAPKLSTIIQINIPLKVTMNKRLKSYDDSYNPGERNFMYIFVHEGTEYVHFASEVQEEQLTLFNPGDELQVVKQEYEPGKTKYIWTDIDGAEARAAAEPQAQSNVKQESSRRKVTTREFEDKVKQICISHQGFAQAFTIGMLSRSTKEIAESDIDTIVADSMVFAKKAREANIAMSIDVATSKS